MREEQIFALRDVIYELDRDQAFEFIKTLNEAQADWKFTSSAFEYFKKDMEDFGKRMGFNEQGIVYTRLKTIKDVRRFVSELINKMYQDKIDVEVAKALLFACDVLLRTFEINDKGLILDTDETEDICKTKAGREIFYNK